MNLGVVRKAWVELRGITLLLALLLAAAEAILAYVLPTYQRGVIGSVLTQSPMAQNFLRALLGSDAPIGAGPELFMSLPWTHPVVLALVWAHAVMCCTRSPAGEIERGTIDLLLGLPVSRWGVYCSESFAWLSATAAIMAMTLIANRLGVAFAPPELEAPLRSAGVVVVNLLALAFAVGGFSCFVSALSDRRGRAVTIVFVTLLASFLINFLSQLWKPAASVDWLSLLAYYRPIFILRDGDWPVRDIAALLGVGAAFWTAGGVVFARRNIATS